MASSEKASVRASLGSELVAAFEAIDTDKSGTIDRAELGAAMRAVLPETTDAGSQWRARPSLRSP